MKKTNTIILLLLAAMLISCAERTNIVTADKALTDLNLSVNLGTRTATDPNAVNAEEAIYSARLIVVGTVKGNANYQKVTCNKYFSAADIGADQIIRARTRTGVSDIYLIVNEEARISTDVSLPTKPLDHIATLGDLEKATLVFPASPVVGGRHIPMMRCFRGVDILPDLTTHVGGDFEGGRVERMWAKVRVHFKSRDEDIAAGKLDLTGSVINSVELHSIPKHILLDEGQRYTDDLTAVDRLITKDYTLAKTIASDEQGYLFYLPEHILTSADRKSYLLVKGTIKGKQRTYRIYLGNNDKPKGDFNITRNQFYDYTGTVCSMGDGEIEIVMDVQPWNVVNSNGSVGEYLKLDKTTINLEYGARQSIVIKTNDVDKTTVSSTGNTRNLFDVNKSVANSTITVNLFANDTLTSVVTPAYDTFTITHGKITKTVTVNYRPHPLYLLAKGDLDAGGNDLGEQCLFINGGGGSGMMFRAASVIGIAVGMGGSPSFSQRIWFQPKTHTYTEIGDNIELVPPVVNTLAEYNQFPNNHPNPYYRQGFLHTPTAESVKAGIGDPCRLVGQTQAQIARGEFNTTWRLPKAGEIDYLWMNPRIVTSHADGGVYIGIKGVNERIAFFSFYPTTIYLLEKNPDKKGLTITATRYSYLTTGVFMPHIHAIEAVSTPESTCGNSYLHQGGFGGEGSLAMLYRVRCIRQ